MQEPNRKSKEKSKGDKNMKKRTWGIVLLVIAGLYVFGLAGQAAASGEFNFFDDNIVAVIIKIAIFIGLIAGGIILLYKGKK